MGKRSDFLRRPRDFYPTPSEAVAPLLPHLPFGSMFVEPCAGNGALVEHLEAGGMSCLAAWDIEPQADWIDVRDALEGTAHGLEDSADYIITNPPWDRRVLHPMIRHFSACRPTWLLFDADWMHTKQSGHFTHLLRKVVSVGRVRWIPGSKMTGKDNAAWYLFDAKASGPTEFVGRLAA